MPSGDQSPVPASTDFNVILSDRLPGPWDPAAALARQVTDFSQGISGWPGSANVSDNASEAVGGAVSLDSTPAEISYAIYGVGNDWYVKNVPYLAPYTMEIVADAGQPFWLAIADFGQRRWRFGKLPLSVAAGQTSLSIDVGLSANGGSPAGNFWFAIVAADGSSPLINEIMFTYPDIPAAGQPVDYHEFVVARDGVSLATDIYLPYAETNPLIEDPPYPVLLMRTPLDKSEIAPWIAPTLTQANVAVVIQYFRGRLGDEPGAGWPPSWPYSWPDSTGMEDFFTDHAGPDHHDAIDTIEWIEQRNWYNGELILSGSSSQAAWIYQVDAALGDRISAIYPQFCAGDVAQWALRENGCYKRSNLEGWIDLHDYPEELQDELESRLANASYWNRWNFDRFAGEARAPGYHESGWYDLNINATIESWRDLQEHGGPGAAGRQWLVIGPWANDAPRGRIVGDYSFPDDGSLHDPAVLPAGWDGTQWVLNEINRWPFAFSEPDNRVLVYLVGYPGSTNGWHNHWLELPDWPPAGVERIRYINDSPGYGLTRVIPDNGYITYAADPRFPIPTLGGANLPVPGVIEAGPLIQDSVLGIPNVLDIYNTDDFGSSDTVFAGVPRLELYFSTDAADTDICVKLNHDNGSSIQYLICDTAIRLSHYLAEHDMGPVVPGQIYFLEFDLGNIGQTFEFTEEIHLIIQGSNYPRFDINPGNGDAIYNGTNGVVQHNTIYFGETYPSRLIMPQFDLDA